MPAAELQNAPEVPDPKLQSEDLKNVGPEVVVESTPARPDYVRVRYTILDMPPLPEAILLGFQQYLTMLGSTVLIPFLIVPAMGGNTTDLAHVISTIFFISGIITLLQTTVGDRLPIIQGGSFAYITPALAIAATIKNDPQYNWAATNAADGSNHERFLVTMREISGGIIGSALIIFGIGFSGLLSLMLRYISPLTVAANIGIVGLALYTAGFPTVGTCVQLGLPMIGFLILFSQYMRNIGIPVPFVGKIRVFELFPVILAIICAWVLGIIVTSSGAYDNSSPATQAACRTDQVSVLHHTNWIRFPYPGQWGAPTFSASGVFTMFAGAISAMIESLGDYYAAARISGAPVPPPGVIARGVTWQGISCVLTGAIGTGNGTTAYNENIGAMQITGVGSRRVIQIGAVIAIFFGLIGKIGGLFASMPQALVAGLFCVMFALIVGVGLSQFQHCDQNSPRNIFCLGFALYMGLSIPDYFTTFTTTYGHGPVNTGSQSFNNIANSIFETGAAVALIITMVLDNTVPGTDEERGLHVWSQFLAKDSVDWWEVEDVYKVYGLPFGMTKRYEAAVGPYKARIHKFFQAFKLWGRSSGEGRV